MPTKCPTCHAENPDVKQFCGDCGTKLGTTPDAIPSVTKTLKAPSKGVRIGSTLAERYRIIDELGRGGMGIVYKAEDLRLKRMVALKFLPPELTQDEEAKDRFVLEARAAAAISHPNICTIHEIDEYEGQTYIAMEYVDGMSLRDLTKKGIIPVPEALDLAVQIASGLEEAHKKGIVHRDIKSANIMMTPSGQAKIMDFGLAKVSGGALITQEGVTMGTVAYMSPEQARGEKVDHRTDIWSLGVVLYEILSGQLPFWGEKESSILYSIEHKEHRPIRAINPDIPGELVAVIDRCLQKKPDTRYKSAKDIISELKRYQDSLRAEEAGFFNLKSLLLRLRKPKVAIPLAVILVAAAALSVWQLNRQAKIRWARKVALPKIEQYITEGDFTSAFQLCLEAKKHISEDKDLIELIEDASSRFSLETEPEGANVYIKDYGDDRREWTLLGQSPLEGILVSRGFKRWKIEKSGYTDVEGALFIFPNDWNIKMKVDREGECPPGMVHINAARFSVPSFPSIDSNFEFRPTLVGLNHLKPYPLGEYFLDKYEVTNKEYKEFINNGGYTNKKYWTQDFIQEGQAIAWENAMPLFVDKTGRPGPATWELGSYPEGQDNYPVSGVSWYEAAAYAEFAGKILPTVYHWNFAGGIADSFWANFAENAYVIPKGNFNGSGPLSVFQSNAISPHGIYDLAGNVEEWCLNAHGSNRFILGGAWDDPQYLYMRAESAPPLMRQETFGFRCMSAITHLDSDKFLKEPIEIASQPEFSQHKPCSDETYHVLRSLFDYVPDELEVEVHDSREWTQDILCDEVSFNANYDNDRMIAYIFLPKKGQPPYQALIFFPGAAAFALRSIFDYNLKTQMDFLVKNNRAVIFPIYKGTFQRPYESIERMTPSIYRKRSIEHVQDISRTIDYLETRPDIDVKKIAFYGQSRGALFASIVPAIEERIRATIVIAFGLYNLPDIISQFNFAPRVNVPILMLFGKYDYNHPIETRVMPLYDLFGTPDENKHLMIYDTGHSVTYGSRWKKDILDFLDRYFGPAK